MKLREADVLKLTLDYLSAKKIWHRRMNTGAVKTEGRFFRFGSKGMADVLSVISRDPLAGVVALPPELTIPPYIVWIECKAGTKQSDAQKVFQKEVEAQGMKYLIVRSLDDLTKAGL